MIPRPWQCLSLVAVLAPAAAHAQVGDPVQLRKDAVESLRAGLSFVELSVLADPPRLTPDFIFAAIDSGEVTLEVLVNRLLAPAADVSDPRRDLLRDAIDALLETSRKVSVAGDTPEHRVLRGRLLLAAARLQDAYQVEVAGLQDAAAGALTDADALPDWKLPAGMVLRRIGGGARINTLTGAYSANLSGELLLPGIDASLTVPRASVDSRGNLDLTAHGSITLPPGDPRGILLTVPSRTPLNLRVGEDGDFRASGGVRLTLPEAIKLDAFFDIADPNYVFSLGYSGGVTLDLAREIHTIRPTVDFTAAQPLAMDALAGFAEFFGSFNAGLETLLREEPSLPDPFAVELGEPPVFETPETIVPFDVLDAWLTAIGNDFVRPAVNGTLDASLEPARSIIRSMRNEVAAVRADLDPTAADIRSLARVVEATASARWRIERAVQTEELSPEQSEQLLDDTALTLQSAAQKAQAWLNGLPPDADIKTLLAVSKLLGDATAKATQAGVITPPDLSIIPPRLTQARGSLLAANGFAADASVADAAKIASLSHEDLLVLVFALQEIDSLAQNAGGSVESIEETRVLIRRWFVKIRDLRQQAIERADMIQELEMSAWLAWSLLLHRDMGFLDLPASPVTPTPDELDLMAFSLPDSHAAIVARQGGTAQANKNAGALILAATKVQKSGLDRIRKHRSALFDEQVTKSSAKQPAGLSLTEISYLNMVRDVTQVMQGRGLLTTAVLSGYKNALTNHLDYFRSEQARKFPETSDVEANLTDATRDLRQLAEGLAFLHSFMPEKVELIGEFTQSWQALRVPWIGVAEAQKAHWVLTAYVRELDRMATSYGIDLAGAFGLSLRASAMEAMAGLNRVTNAMNGLAATLGAEDVAFPLPGDLKINSAFGKLAFNRLTGDWTLGFGGGIEFPESAFALDVFDATLSKSGAFNLNLGTRGEVPLGGDGSKMKFVVPQFAVNGNTTQQQLALNTTGTLTYDPTTTAGDEFALDLGVSYDSQTGLVGLNAGLNNSPVRFGEDLVLLDGDVGLDFSAQNPQGALEVAGTFGVLARQKPLQAGALQADDFWLTFSIEPTRFNFTEEAMTAEINGGSITLPADLFSSQAQPGDPPVSVAIGSPLCLRYDFATGAVSFCNPAGQPFTVDLENFKLALDELPGFQLAITSARLELNGSEFPVLRNLTAAVTVPLPGANASDASQNTSSAFNISAQNWRIDGLPEAASIGIAQNLQLADFNGFKLDLLDGATFSLASTPGFPRTLTLGLAGGIRAGFDERILRNNNSGNAVFLTGNGSLSWDMQSLPVLQGLDLALEGNFRFGADGPAITGLEDNTLARLEVQNVGGLFNQVASPVFITLEGAVDIPNALKFGLLATRFSLRGNGLEFEPGGFQTELRGQTLELAKDVLPVYLTKIGLAFKNPHPLVPHEPGDPALFDLTNLKFVFSGGANIPNGAALDSGVPGLAGEVRDLEMGLRLDGQGNLLPEFNVDAIALQVENLTIPPLAELKGGIAVVNLDQLSLDPPRPERVTFVGELGGFFNGVGAGALVASSATQFHGLAITANAGPVGIPLDGYALGGIIWNGATGGIHFKNSFDDPTEFSTYLQRDSEGNITGANEFPPPGDPGENATNISDPFDELEEGGDLYTKSDLPETPQGFDPFDMLQDNWPPRAANPLLEEFPAGSGRLVFKATRLNSELADDFLDRIGLTENDPRDMEQVIAAFLTEMTDEIRSQGDAAVTALIAASGVAGSQKLVEHYQELSDKLVASFDDAARPVLRQILQPAAQAGTSLRPPLRDLLTSGIPGFNVTFLGSGTFTHTALAPVMDVKGTVSVSTTGAALSRGELRVSGIPVAEASVGVSLTNETGNISPFLGGLARVGIGPMEFGKLTMSASLPDAAAVVGHFDNFMQCALSTLGSGAQAQFQIIAENAIGAQVPVGTALQDFLLARNEREKLAVAGALFDYFARTAEGTLPQQFALAENDFNTLLNCFAVFVANSLNSFTPEIGFGGKIQPSLFDIPMTASGMPLASARMRFGPVLRTPNGGESLIELLGNPAANLAPGTLPGVRQFSAYAQFSPTALVLSPISGLFVALNPSNAAFVGFTALDSAELGFSSQIEEWTPAKVITFLTNPPQYFADRTEEFFNTAVLAAGYKMSPFGMTLADGQLRVVFPDSNLHPRRPGGINAARLGNPVQPFDSNGTRTLPLPATDELILAALTAGKIKDATFRGGLDQLDDLFPPPPAQPATDGNLRKVHEVSASLRALDPDLSELAGKSFAKDYFPYGGIIGGGQLALPQLLTRGLPPNWGDLFTKQGAEWLQSFESVATFLASTDSVGQLAYYIPAPNPVLFPGENANDVWANMTIDDLLRRLQMDPAALVGRTINTDLYELDEINLAGWAKADLLGIPLGEARLGYDGNSRRLLATANLPPNTANDGNWFNDFFSGEAQFSIQLPSDQQSGLVTYGATELFTHIQQNLGSIQSLSGAELDARIAQIQDSLKGALPRISAEIETGVQLPAELQSVMRAQSDAGFFAFSPYFEPEYEPSNNSPYALARRRGGLGIKGAFDFGFFPPTGDPIVISVPSASLALTPSADVAVAPAISGELQVGEFSIPGAPTFENGLLQFASSPDDGAPYLTVRGNIEPFVFQLPTPGGPVDLLRAQPLPPAAGLSASFQVLRSDASPDGSALDLRLDPLSAAIPFLGPQVAITMHGGPNGTGGFNPFSFSTAEGASWSAQVSLSAPGNPAAAPTFAIRNPFDPAGGSLMSFTPSGPVNGTVTGTGLEGFSAGFTVPTGFEVVFYEGTPFESRVLTPGGRNMVFAFDSSGRVYCDLGDLTNISLPGLIQAGARIEFGYNPTDPQPDVLVTLNGNKVTTPVSFGSINLVDSAVRTLVVRNDGTLPANVGFNISQGTTLPDFTLAHDGFQLEPGGQRELRIVFQPKAGGARSATLQVTSNDPDSPLQSFTLSGTGLQEPRYFASRPNIDFGSGLVGSTSLTTVTIGNSGSANMTVNAPFISGSGFTITPTTSTTLAPGAERVYTVSFTPAAQGTVTGSLTIPVNAPAVSTAIPLAGAGGDTGWVQILDAQTAGSSANLNAIKMLDTKRGYIAGDAGTLLETRDGGRSWIPRELTSASLNGFAYYDNADSPLTNTSLASYQFDEAPGTPTYLDSSGNLRHGLPAPGSAAPITTFSSGKFGSGLSLDGVDDYGELAVFPLPSSFSISVWCNPKNPGLDGQAIVANNDTAGGNRFILGFYNGGYQINFMSQTWVVPAVRVSGWQHFLVTGSYNATTNQTTITLRRNGTSLGSNTFNNALAASTGRRWLVGQEWDNDGTGTLIPTDFFRGDIDAVQFFDGVVSTGRGVLEDFNGSVLAVVGNSGRVYQTYGSSGLWAQHPDLNAAGWRNQSRAFQIFDWYSATYNSSGKLILGGHRHSGASRVRALMYEDRNAGVDGQSNTADDEFAEIFFSSAPAATDPRITGAAGYGNILRVVGSDGVVYTENQSVTNTVAAGTPTAAGGLNAITYHNFFNSFVAVGNNGAIIQANSSTPVTRTSGTTANLTSVAYDGDATPSYHAVGSPGAWLTSDNFGQNWTVNSDKPAGNLRGVDVKHEPTGAASDYHVWAVGEQHAAHLRPPQPPSGPFITFFPGKLDFGFLLLGETKTREITLTNRGRQNLSFTSISISGPAASRFTRTQSSLPSLRPGESGRIIVRYQPTGTASAFDSADLVISTNDAGQTFRVPLQGSCANNNWQPSVLALNGVPISGQVAQIEFTSATRGYALVNPSGQSSVLYHTANGGATWVRSNIGSFGGVLKLVAMDFARPSGSSSDVGMLAGHVEDENKNFIKGLLLRTIVSNASNVAPVWTVQTPLGASQPLPIADVALTASFIGAGTSNLRCVAATTGNASTANVWESSNSGDTWSTPANRPSGFNGGPVATMAASVFTPVLAASGSQVHMRIHNGGNWGSPSQVVQLPGNIRDMQFFFSNAIGADFNQGWALGDNGSFLLWNPADSSGLDWFPAKNAEVFGTRNLSAVHSSNLYDVWVVGESRVFQSRDQGLTWALNFDAGEEAVMKTVSSDGVNAAWVGGSVSGKAAIWRYTPPPAPTPPVLTSIGMSDFANVTAGSSPSTTITLTNNGSSTLPIHHLEIESSDPASRFRITDTTPTSIAPGASANVSLAFSATADPSLAAELNPSFMHRFEQEWDATVFLDDSSNARHAEMVNFSGGITNPVNRRPRLAGSFLRDRCLYFDGDDMIELNQGGGGPDNFAGGKYAVSLWVAPDSVPVNTDMLVAKDSSTGADRFEFSLQPTGYRVAVRTLAVDLGGVPKTGWQHLVVNCTESGGNIAVDLYRDGVLIGSGTITGAVLGNASGKPWTIGSEWTSSTAYGSGFVGSIDDVAVFERTLTEGEIRQLAAKSPLYGVHEAELVVRSGSEGGERRVNLRANVAPAAEFITLRTEPEGLPIQVDGVNYTSPVSFAVVHSASSQPGAREWVEGSRHRITAVANHTIPNADGSVGYNFHEWSGGGGREFFLTAQRVGATYTATYVPGVITAPGIAAPPPRSTGATILQGLAGSPKGPFLRITNGNLTLPNLGTNGFSITGDLYLSSQRFQGRIASTALNLPATGTSRFLEVGASNWSVDATAGGPFELTARPPSVRLIGYDAIPEGQVKLAFTPAAGPDPAKWLAEFQLLRDFKPLPDMLEFRKGRARVEWFATAGAPAFALEMNGGIRILKTPSGTFALNQPVNLRFDTVNFDLSLNQALASAGIAQPANLLQTGPFRIGWGDVRLRRVNGGPVFFEVAGVPFDFNNTNVATVTGAVSTAGELSFNGTIASNGLIRLDPDGNLRLKRTGSNGAFQMVLNSQPNPRLRFSTPPMRLETTGSGANGNFLPNGIDIPGLDIDTAGAFDTGKLALPSLNFDGISMSAPSGGDRDDNHIRLRRDSAGVVTFNAKSEQDFLGDPQNLSMKLRVSGGSLSASGSIHGRFVLLPEPISLNYDSSQSCQFSGSAFGFTVYFGTGFGGVTARDPISGNQVTVIGNVP